MSAQLLPGGQAGQRSQYEPPGQPDQGPARRGPGQARQWWRHGRTWLLIGLAIVLAGIVAGLLRPQPGGSYLNPGSTGRTGSHALADVLTGLGHQVTAVTSVGAAISAASAGSTLVITSPAYLSGPELAALATVPANVLLVAPDATALAALHAGLSISDPDAPVGSIPAGCTLYAAVLAGTADMGGVTLATQGRPPAGLQRCYPVGPDASLIQLTVRGRRLTVLGTGVPLTNAGLASQGNAALAINLLPSRRIVWLVPPLAVVAATGPATPRSFFSLVPLAAYLVAIQLAVAVLLAAAWRARRLGPLVAEPLPVVVRAAETAEGHGRLYQSRRARGRTADALRSALVSRAGLAAGLPAGAGREAVVAALEPRSARTAQQVTELLYGPAPRSDQALADLARELDEFEREVGKS